MKRKILGVFLLIFCLGYIPQVHGQLTVHQKEKVKREVKVIIDSLISKFERLDATAEMQYYSDSPEFIAFNPYGSRHNYAEFEKAITGILNSAVSAKILTTRKNIMILASDLAICGWSGTTHLTLKSGKSIVFDPDAVTFLLRKLDGKWKVIWFHESATIGNKKTIMK